MKTGIFDFGMSDLLILKDIKKRLPKYDYMFIMVIISECLILIVFLKLLINLLERQLIFNLKKLSINNLSL